MQKAIVIAGHAGVGKSCLARKYDNILDFDHLFYKYVYPEKILKNTSFEQLKGMNQNRTINSSWPQNYIDELAEKNKEYKIILIPASLEILDYLDEINFEYILCYPTIESKPIYMKRYMERGTNQEWVEKMNRNFEDAIRSFDAKKVEKIILQSDETLEDKLKEMNIIE